VPLTKERRLCGVAFRRFGARAGGNRDRPRIPSRSRDEIIIALMRIVALAGDGHTNIYPTRDRVIAFSLAPGCAVSLRRRDHG